MSLKKRSEVLIKDTWNMTDMLLSDEAWEELLESTQSELQKYSMYKGKLSQSADILYECMKLDDKISQSVELLYVYAKQKSDEDTANQKYQDYSQRALTLSFKAAELSSYIVPEILEIDDKKLSALMNADNGISHFKRIFEMLIKKKPHTLSQREEEIIAASFEATQGTSQIFNMFNNADIKFPEINDAEGNAVRITHGNFISLMENKDREVRASAFRALYSVYGQFKNTLAAVFQSNIKQSVFYAKIRRYSSDREQILSENEIPEAVYDNLIDAVNGRLGYLHEYAAFRKKALKLDELHMYDLYTPLISDADRKYTFEEAKDIVREGLKPLGREYAAILEEGFSNRWIDVYENEGKRSGAYSWGAYGIHPYVLLNFNGTLNNVFTLAHEMGHAIHSYYSDKNQPFTYAGYKIFVAEVASTCNEALLIRHLLSKSTDRKERCYLLNYFLESFRGTLYRQTMFAEFEAKTHKMAEQGESLTADVLGEIYLELNKKYFGEDTVVDEEISMEWARIPHFYTPFYVYQYATGFSAAVAISSKIIAGDESAVKGYFKFLSGGNSMPPIELLKLCGIDMTSTEPVEKALDVFGELLDELREEYELI